MQKKPTGGNAFPVMFTDAQGQGLMPGMTLRDYFAAQAMAAMIRENECTSSIPKWAYEMADEMIAARDRNYDYY